MAAPDDTDLVQSAMRLGWYLAQVRGQNRPDPPPAVNGSMPDRTGHALPLRVERTDCELRIEAQTVLAALATKLNVNSMNDGSKFTDVVEAKSKDLAARRRAKDDAGASAAWALLTQELYNFDAHVQDTLTALSDTQACGYQLGRGLAETYWALDPTLAEGSRSCHAWWFLLGPGRCGELSRLVGRLAAYFNDITAPAIAGCLEVWKAVAADDRWRADPDAVKTLSLQTRRWYELMILGQDPATLVAPFALLKGYRTLLRAIRLFWPQLVGAAVSLVAVVTALFLIAVGSSTPLGRTLVGAVGVVGLSVTSLSAKLKSSAQGLLRRIRDDAYTDLVAVAITVVPPPPGAQRLPRTSTTTERVVTRTVRNRKLSTGAAV